VATRKFYEGIKRWAVKLSSHLHLLSSLRINGDRSHGFHMPSAHSSGKRYLENIYNAIFSPRLVNMFMSTYTVLKIAQLVLWKSVLKFVERLHMDKRVYSDSLRQITASDKDTKTWKTIRN